MTTFPNAKDSIVELNRGVEPAERVEVQDDVARLDQPAKIAERLLVHDVQPLVQG